MYCQNCGTSATPGLSYCSRCGVELTKVQKPGDMTAESLAWSIVAVAVIGMGIVIAMMALMSEMLGIKDATFVLVVSLLTFIPFALAEVLFIWMLVKSQLRSKRSDAMPQLKSSTTRELEGAKEQFLNEPAVSITDHTTRGIAMKAKVIRMKDD